MRHTLIRLLLAAVVTLSVTALADARHVNVSMKDGRSFEGEIVEESSKEIVLSYTMGSLKTKMTLARADIASITDAEAPSADPPRQEPEPAVRERPREREQSPRVRGQRTR